MFHPFQFRPGQRSRQQLRLQAWHSSGLAPRPAMPRQTARSAKSVRLKEKVQHLLATLRDRSFLRLLGLSALCLALAQLCFPLARPYFPLTLAGFLPLLTLSLRRFSGKQQEDRAEKDFYLLLAFLSGALLTGEHLEHALIRARDVLREELGERSLFFREISKLSSRLYSGLSLRESLQSFVQPFALAQMQIFAQVLPGLVERGGRYELFLSLQRDALQKRLEMKAELQAEQSSAMLESFLMSLMPFFLSRLLSSSALYEKASAFPALSLIQSVFLWLALGVLLLCLRQLREGLAAPRWPRGPGLFPEEPPPFLARLLAPLLAQMDRFYSEERRRRLRHQLELLYPRENEVWPRYGTQKLALAGLAALLLGLGGLPLLSLPAALLTMLFCDAILLDAQRQLKLAEIAEYPVFLRLLAILLESGLSLERSLHLLLPAFLEGHAAKKRSPLAHDLERLRQGLESGATGNQVLEKLAGERYNAEIAQCLYLIARYAREGQAEQIQMIRLEALRSEDIYRHTMRERLGRKGLRLLLPMGLDLILVMLISVFPALLEFTGVV